MALSKTSGTQIQGIISVVPQTTVDNLSFELLPIEEREAIVKHTGIRFRKIAAKTTSVKDLFATAIEALLKKLEWEKESIDVLICVTQSPNMLIPSVSNRLHGDLDFPVSTLCFDINSGCSGFVYGLYTVNSMLSGLQKTDARAILCCGDLSSQLIEPNDKSVQPIFSDAISAIGIDKSTDPSIVNAFFNLETDGKGQNAIAMATDQFMRLNGIDVFNYSVKNVPGNIENLLQFASKSVENPDLFVFHQANKLINESIRKKLKINPEKVPYSLYEYGNTASASIPLTLGTIWEHSEKKSGWILLSGFGVGFSIGSALIQFDPKFCFSPIEV